MQRFILLAALLAASNFSFSQTQENANWNEISKFTILIHTYKIDGHFRIPKTIFPHENFNVQVYRFLEKGKLELRREARATRSTLGLNLKSNEIYFVKISEGSSENVIEFDLRNGIIRLREKEPIIF